MRRRGGAFIKTGSRRGHCTPHLLSPFFGQRCSNGRWRHEEKCTQNCRGGGLFRHMIEGPFMQRAPRGRFFVYLRERKCRNIYLQYPNSSNYTFLRSQKGEMNEKWAAGELFTLLSDKKSIIKFQSQEPALNRRCYLSSSPFFSPSPPQKKPRAGTNFFGCYYHPPNPFITPFAFLSVDNSI